MDFLSHDARSLVMSRIRGSDTGPEIVVRRMLHALGYRFRLRRRDLPGTPDVVLPRYKTVLFVHGCFWHRHDCARGRSTPVSNPKFWKKKFEANRSRDRSVTRRLSAAGWKVITIWECETRDAKTLARNLRAALRPRTKR